ncbi:ABC transporter ATP-binding protein [Fundicoccus culcitae]|uniref:ABC transporter ATP-binding protein n=1 Tax=Fundicoccus culcitae TaxID=2969821 RepID=UPI0028BE80CF|nr:ABC transporter ATP-binding protein [Fundicoccus culcitae]
MGQDALLRIEDLEVSYGPIRAVKGISMEVKEGTIVALIGANGAGKTSLLSTISGVTPSSKGKIYFDGTDITKLAPEKITRLGISQSPEGRQIFPDLTVKENLLIGGYVIKSKDVVNENLEKVFSFFPRLEERLSQPAVTLSGGEQQMLAIGRALMNNPKLLLLDEPSLGLAPIIVKNILEIISDIAKQGTTVLIVEQNAVQTLKIADYAYVLEVGRISNEGTSDVLLNDSTLIESYLGKTK